MIALLRHVMPFGDVSSSGRKSDLVKAHRRALFYISGVGLLLQTVLQKKLLGLLLAPTRSLLASTYRREKVMSYKASHTITC